MTFLLPSADEVADEVARRLPQATVARYEDGGHDLDDVDFYCLPYMGNGLSVGLIAKLPRLRVLQSLSSGVDNLLGAVPEQVTLCNGRGLHHEESTAELAVSLILASLRQLPAFALDQSRRRWHHVRTDSLDGKKVLLVGYGGMGKAIEQRLRPFGAQIIRSSRTARDGVAPLADLPRLAAGADILVVCIALTPGTQGLIGAEVLAALPDGAVVVNVARGPIVDAAALAGHLTNGRLHAALDVTDVEPLPADRPEWALPNVLITPHIGGTRSPSPGAPPASSPTRPSGTWPASRWPTSSSQRASEASAGGAVGTWRGAVPHWDASPGLGRITGSVLWPSMVAQKAR